MAKRGEPHRVGFRVIACSGEDADHPVTELHEQTPHTRGWQSKGFCEYPQYLVLRAERACHLHKLQILSHQSKIPSRIEIHVGMAAQSEVLSLRDISFRRLGYTTLDTNQRSQYRARELKSVHTNAPCEFVKLVVHKNHVNEMNLYNQVGIVAINLLGSFPSENAPMGHEFSHELHGAARALDDARSGSSSASVPHTEDIGFDLVHDPAIAHRIRSLYRAKEQYAANEMYAEAKLAKNALERLEALGRQIARLEQAKLASVRREDYDSARTVKEKVDILRRDAEEIFHRAMARAERTPEAPSITKGQEHRSPTLVRRSPTAFAGSSSGTVSAAPEAKQTEHGGTRDAEVRHDIRLHSPTTRNAGDSPVRESPGGEDGVPLAQGPPSPARHGRRPPTKAVFPRALDDVVLPTHTASEAMEPSARFECDQEESARGDMAPPSTLTEEQAREMAAFVSIFGEDVAAKAVSAVWQHREAALDDMQGHLSSEHTDSAAAVAAAAGQVMHRLIRDKIPHVALAALQTFRHLVSFLDENNGGRECGASLETAVSQVILRIGDANARIRTAAAQVITEIASTHFYGPGHAVHQTAKLPKRLGDWRRIQGRADTLALLVRQHGVHSPAAPDQLFHVASIALQNPKKEARAAGAQLAAAVTAAIGRKPRKLLDSLTPHVRETVEAAIEAEKGPAAQSSPSAHRAENVERFDSESANQPENNGTAEAV